jgi:hypothetical protein
MLKRLLITAAMACSTLAVTGPLTAQAANATPGFASGTQTVVTTQTTEAAQRCEWRKQHGRWCFYCWHRGRWERVYCRWDDRNGF